MSVTFEQVIKNFLDGIKQNEDGAKSSTGTLKIQGNQLIHYWTPIAERCEGKIIVNISRYSLATGKLQKQLKEIVPEEQYVPIKGVCEGYKGLLTDFLSKR